MIDRSTVHEPQGDGYEAWLESLPPEDLADDAFAAFLFEGLHDTPEPYRPGEADLYQK